MNDKIVVQIRLQLADLIEAANESPLTRRLDVLSVALPATLMISCLVIQWLRTGTLSWTLLVVAIGFVATVRYYYLRARKQGLQSSVATGTEQSYELDATGVTLRGSSLTERVPWSDFHKLSEGKATFMLFTSPRRHVILFKRAFSSGDLEQVRALMKANVSQL